MPKNNKEDSRLREIAALVALFLTCNIPTAAFGGIWLYYKNRHDFQDGLRRMNIQDLE